MTLNVFPQFCIVGTCLGHVMFGTCSARAWDMFLDVLGIIVRHLGYTLGTCVGHFWGHLGEMFGTCSDMCEALKGYKAF